MRRGVEIFLAVLGVAWSLGIARDAHALNACTAADIEAQEPGCPATTGPCQITKSFDIGDGCTLDFGIRAVTIASNGTFGVGPRHVDIRAGSLTIASGGSIDGRGNQAPPANRGGMVNIQTTGPVKVMGTLGKIDVSGNDGAGAILITAGGTVTVAGRLLADGGLRFGFGGTVRIITSADIDVQPGSVISATGAREGGCGGAVDLQALGRVDLNATVDVSGSEGGALDVMAGGEIVVRGVRGRGTGDAGSGGCMDLAAGTNLQLLGLIDFNGTGGESGGGCGGFLCFGAAFGDVTVLDDIRAEGATPDGGGGAVTFMARGSVHLVSGRTVSVRGNGGDGCGGEVCVEIDGSVIGAGFVDASGGIAGGDVDLMTRADMSITGSIDVRGRTVGGFGGDAVLEAGADGFGTLSVGGSIDVGGGGCSAVEGGGFGGIAQLVGCEVTLAPNGSVAARATAGGDIEFTAREHLTIGGTVNATTSATGSSACDPIDGTTQLTYRSGRTPVITGNAVRPVPTLVVRDACTRANEFECLIPCPTCGDGTVGFPETCDDGPGTPQSCDGCSTFCRVENCDDGSVCTIDSCDAQLGCRHESVAPTPCTPGPTPTRTRTATATVTRTSSQTPTATRTFSTTATASATPTPTASATATSTSTTLPTATTTATPTTTETPSPTPTSPPSPTSTRGCVGDCGGDGRVTIDELVRGVSIALGGRPVSDCPSFDRNQDQRVSIDELVAGVRNALNGC